MKVGSSSLFLQNQRFSKHDVEKSTWKMVSDNKTLSYSLFRVKYVLQMCVLFSILTAGISKRDRNKISFLSLRLVSFFHYYSINDTRVLRSQSSNSIPFSSCVKGLSSVTLFNFLRIM